MTRLSMSARISKLRRRLRRGAAVQRLRAAKVAPLRATKHVQLTGANGTELTAPADTLRAISRHCKAQYGDRGQAAQLALQRASSEVRAAALDGQGGGGGSSPTRPSGEPLSRSGDAKGRRQAPMASPASNYLKALVRAEVRPHAGRGADRAECG